MWSSRNVLWTMKQTVPLGTEPSSTFSLLESHITVRLVQISHQIINVNMCLRCIKSMFSKWRPGGNMKSEKAWVAGKMLMHTGAAYSTQISWPSLFLCNQLLFLLWFTLQNEWKSLSAAEMMFWEPQPQTISSRRASKHSTHWGFCLGTGKLPLVCRGSCVTCCVQMLLLSAGTHESKAGYCWDVITSDSDSHWSHWSWLISLYALKNSYSYIQQ